MSEKEFKFEDLAFLSVKNVEDYNPNKSNFICGVLNSSKTKLMDVVTGDVYDCKSEKITIKTLKKICLDFYKNGEGNYYDETETYNYNIEKDGMEYESCNLDFFHENNYTYTCKLSDGIFSSDKFDISLFNTSSKIDFTKELNVDDVELLLNRMEIMAKKRYDKINGIKTATNKKVAR